MPLFFVEFLFSYPHRTYMRIRAAQTERVGILITQPETTTTTTDTPLTAIMIWTETGMWIAHITLTICPVVIQG